MARDPYDVLGVARDATLGEARAAYRRLVEIFHPDRFQGGRQAVREEATRRLRELNEAWRAVSAGQAPRPLRARPAAPSRSAPEPQPPAPPTPLRRTPAGGPAEVMYDTGLRSLDPDRPLHIRWGGERGRVTLKALIAGFADGAPQVRQVDWGAYELVGNGTQARAFLAEKVFATPGPEPVMVVEAPRPQRTDELQGPAPEPGQQLARRGQLAVRDILDLIEPSAQYRIYAEDF